MSRAAFFMSMDPCRPFYLVGPTGSGKSTLALELAERCGGEIVNADAYQIYDELRILTARPSPEEEARLSHHLYGALSVTEICDAGRYLNLAKPVIEEISGRGRVPIVVGGSGLYVKALTHGLDDVPSASPEIREELNALDDKTLLAQLKERDPEALTLIDPRNRRYVQRALEIILTTGQPWTETRKAWAHDPEELRGAFINWPRELLYARIDERVPQMFAAGAVAEVQAIFQWSVTSERAIGVLEVQQLLAGELDEATCITAIQQSTRRYAKRQLTWFRREKWLHSVELEPEMSLREVLDELETFLIA